MRTYHFAVWLITVLAGALYTVIQTGPDTAGANLCALVKKVVPATTSQCVPSFENWGPTAILIIGLIFGFLVIIDIVGWINRRRQQSPPRHGGKFSEIMEAIWWVAERSAWGRWQSAQRPMIEIEKLHTAEQMVRTAAENGEIVISGRVGGTTKYEPIDQHFWRLVVFDIQPNNISLWRASLRPRSGVTTPIPNYDSFILNRSDLESLPWLRGWRLEWLIVKLQIKTFLKQAPYFVKTNMQPTHLIILGLVIAAIGVAWQLYRKPQAVAQGTGSSLKVDAQIVKAPTAAVVANIKAPLEAEIQALKEQIANLEKRAPKIVEEELVMDGVFEWRNFSNVLPGYFDTNRVRYISQFNFTGYYRGKTPMVLEDARVTSRVTADEILLRVMSDPTYVYPNELNPIPPDAQLVLQGLLYDPEKNLPPEKQGLRKEDFLIKWGGVTLTIKYRADGQNLTYGHVFSYQDLVKMLAGPEQEPPRPIVTRKKG